jgi:hypothetical protein
MLRKALTGFSPFVKAVTARIQGDGVRSSVVSRLSSCYPWSRGVEEVVAL